MANLMKKDKIIEQSIKHKKEDRIHIITSILQSLSEEDNNNKLQVEIDILKKELDLYKKNSSKIIREYVNNELKKQE
ncbi:hypothetical protein [Dysgonomonas macrotermitis]|uniref:Uncharacterized protein n=1 Tax=Dysgonomonas macrotermitis TaxID=1346286 RepID=A0A1M5C6Q9_9BACT|nr:hypothetical protein [Dysgonomonas macrotermitis]SHF50429.1 hypothetical protein SAMN05444362_10753 [Dysgonomonas macrotermitis]